MIGASIFDFEDEIVALIAKYNENVSSLQKVLRGAAVNARTALAIATKLVRSFPYVAGLEPIKQVCVELKLRNASPDVIILYCHGQGAGIDCPVLHDKLITGAEVAQQVYESGLRPNTVIFAACSSFPAADEAHRWWLKKHPDVESPVWIAPTNNRSKVDIASGVSAVPIFVRDVAAYHVVHSLGIPRLEISLFLPARSGDDRLDVCRRRKKWISREVKEEMRNPTAQSLWALFLLEQYSMLRGCSV